MGLFRSVPVTVAGLAEKNQLDKYKADGGPQENATAPEQNGQKDREAEKAVVRKLDWRVLSLVYVLCIMISERLNLFES